MNEIINYMSIKVNNLDILFVEIYELTGLILTFSPFTATEKEVFLYFKNVKAYLRVTSKQIRLSKLALCIFRKFFSGYENVAVIDTY